MTVVLYIALCLNISTFTDIDHLRINYLKAPEDKVLCSEMIDILNARQKSPVELAYLGAFQAISAKHEPNPFSKLASFREGKKNIERAIIKQPDNVEIRFIRLSIQKNAPGILGYKSDISEDETFLRANYMSIDSIMLRRMVDQLINDKK